MTTLLENPLPGIAIAGLLTLGFAAGWLKTGYHRLLLGVAFSLLLGAAAVLLERWVETPREQVTATLLQIAADVESNDHDKALAHIHSARSQLLARGAQELSKYTFTRVDLKSHREITVDTGRSPPRAVAEFNVVVEIEQYGGPIPRLVTLTLYQEDGRWKIYDYSHGPVHLGRRMDEGQ